MSEARAGGVRRGRLRVLGIDPGTRIVGYGVVDFAAGRPPVAIDYGAIRTGRGAMAGRLLAVHTGLGAVIRRLGPDVAAVEEVFYGKSFRSALRMGEGRGVALLCCAEADLAVVEYPAAVIKQAVTGNGRAPKLQVAEMVMRLLGLERRPETPDVTDALAMALCHGYRAARPGRQLSGKRGDVP